MASLTLKIVLFILLIIEILCIPIDNKIYNPDEFKLTKKLGKLKITSPSSIETTARSELDDLNSPEIPPDKNLIPDLGNRHLTYVPCRENYVEIKGKCIRSW